LVIYFVSLVIEVIGHCGHLLRVIGHWGHLLRVIGHWGHSSLGVIAVPPMTNDHNDQ